MLIVQELQDFTSCCDKASVPKGSACIWKVLHCSDSEAQDRCRNPLLVYLALSFGHCNMGYDTATWDMPE